MSYHILSRFKHYDDISEVNRWLNAYGLTSLSLSTVRVEMAIDFPYTFGDWFATNHPLVTDAFPGFIVRGISGRLGRDREMAGRWMFFFTPEQRDLASLFKLTFGGS